MKNTNDTQNNAYSQNTPQRKFRGKIGLRITFLVIICFCTVIAITAFISLRTSRRLAERLQYKSCVSTNKILAAELGSDADLTDDHSELLDRLKESTGCELTIFSDNIRTSTTIIKDGRRAIGTVLNSSVAEIVLDNKESYTGEADILGTKHLCSYVPIIKDDKAVGLLFAGISYTEVNSSIGSTTKIVVITSLSLLAVISLLVFLFMYIGISHPLGKLTSMAKEMERGNLGISSGNELRTNIHSSDEIGQLAFTFEETFNRLRGYIMEISKYLGTLASKNLNARTNQEYVGDFTGIHESLENISTCLNETMLQIHCASNEVSAGSEQVAQASQLLSSGAIQQASAIEELTSSLTKISDHVDHNASSTKDVSDKAVVIDNFIQDTNNQMHQMVDAMDRIALTSAEIEKIDKIIEDIAFRTNILALNASVEAGRAGAAGKGFAVVANEVRTLAGKSTEAAKTTASLISQMLHDIQSGTSIVNSTVQSTEKAAESVDEIVTLITGISEATQEQAASLKQFTGAIREISSIVQTNSSTAEESAAASEELSSRAETLLSMVDSFTLKE